MHVGFERSESRAGQPQRAIFDEQRSVAHRAVCQRLRVRKLMGQMPMSFQFGIELAQGLTVTDEHNLQAFHCTPPAGK